MEPPCAQSAPLGRRAEPWIPCPPPHVPRVPPQEELRHRHDPTCRTHPSDRNETVSEAATGVGGRVAPRSRSDEPPPGPLTTIRPMAASSDGAPSPACQIESQSTCWSICRTIPRCRGLGSRYELLDERHTQGPRIDAQVLQVAQGVISDLALRHRWGAFFRKPALGLDPEGPQTQGREHSGADHRPSVGDDSRPEFAPCAIVRRGPASTACADASS